MYSDALVPAVARQLLDGILAQKKGDFSVQMPAHLIGIEGKMADCSNEVALSWPFAQVSPAKQQILRTLYENDDVLRGRTVLILEDDIRNIFAMISVLEQHGMSVLTAESGQQAIEQLNLNANIEMVLMNILMQDHGGFDTMRAIRRIPRFESLPIVAVRAKAMKGDWERSIEAGAWDYLSKPEYPLQMVSSCRAWLRAEIPQPRRWARKVALDAGPSI
jgi:CheY-like chemotaxis protein